MTDAPTEREGEGAWAKLRRRKVVQWGLAYAGGAWALAQALAHLVTTYHWSEQIQQVGTLLLVIGLPIAVVLAWYHGDRGEQRVSGTELVIILLLMLLGCGFLWHYERSGERVATPDSSAGPLSAATTYAAPPAVADTRPSIAVLPFENRSAKQDDVFFVDGIHDDILTQLAKVSAMKVISRTSVERFRDTKLPIKNIAEQLGVTKILEGGVQRAGDRVRITVQLVDAGTDGHVWAETYDRELTAANIFAIQSEVAAAIAATLNATLTPDETTRVNAIPTQNLAAWEAYQLGRQRLATKASADLKDAEKYFQKAITLDPEFALPYSGLADTLMAQIFWGGVPKETNFARAEQMARKALELGPNLAESWTTSATFAQDDRREANFRKAIALNPNYALAYVKLAMLLVVTGRSEEALTYSKMGLELDPLSSSANFDHARILVVVGRFDEAEAHYRKVIELEPLRPNTYRDLAMLFAYVRNDFVSAIPFAEKLVELDPDAPYARCNLAQLYVDLGDLIQAARVLEMARKRMPGSASVLSWLADVRLYQGNEAEAARLARQALAIDSFSADTLIMIDMKREDYASARSRFAQLYPKMLDSGSPHIDVSYLRAALDLVSILRMTGETERATQLLDRSRAVIATSTRLSEAGYGIADAQIHALRGDKARAIAALREAEKAGWRGPVWRRDRDFSPTLASIRNDPEFKAVFADIERDMARQRAELAKRPKDARRELKDANK